MKGPGPMVERAGEVSVSLFSSQEDRERNVWSFPIFFSLFAFPSVPGPVPLSQEQDAAPANFRTFYDHQFASELAANYWAGL